MFKHNLSTTLHKPINEILATHDSEELSTWLAFFSVNPQGEARADYRAALICSAINNAMGGTLKPNDFMPDYTASADPTKLVSQHINEAMFALVKPT
jgi:hypothetical protein